MSQPGNPHSQSHAATLLESLSQIAIGYTISVLANIWLLPLWGYQVSLRQGVEIGLLFTLISFIRSYLLRRLFNYFHYSRFRS